MRRGPTWLKSGSSPSIGAPSLAPCPFPVGSVTTLSAPPPPPGRFFFHRLSRKHCAVASRHRQLVAEMETAWSTFNWGWGGRGAALLGRRVPHGQAKPLSPKIVSGFMANPSVSRSGRTRHLHNELPDPRAGPVLRSIGQHMGCSPAPFFFFWVGWPNVRVPCRPTRPQLRYAVVPAMDRPSFTAQK